MAVVEPDDVAAGEQRGDGRGLDRRGRLVADVGQRTQHGLGQSEVREGGGLDGRVGAAGALGVVGAVGCCVITHPTTVVAAPVEGRFLGAVGSVTREWGRATAYVVSSPGRGSGTHGSIGPSTLQVERGAHFFAESGGPGGGRATLVNRR